ncbi:MAG: HNH endonuclease [Desulfobulbaceae bacterium]|nr:HNH endonuclease [Desulfobulbaceae bacterium]
MNREEMLRSLLGELGGFEEPDEAAVRAERNKARQLRKTRWWQQKTASGACWYCGEKVGYANLTMDHVIPLVRGGRSTRDNLVPCCKACNNKKKSSLPVEWDEYMDALNKRSE